MSQTSPRYPEEGLSALGASAGMVPWQPGLKLCKEMGTNPGGSMTMFGLGNPAPRFRGPYSPNCAFFEKLYWGWVELDLVLGAG